MLIFVHFIIYFGYLFPGTHAAMQNNLISWKAQKYKFKQIRINPRFLLLYKNNRASGRKVFDLFGTDL